jgi:two-component system, OmpR family, response regulator MtrA
MTTVVVADDDPDVRDLVQFKLEQAGIDVVGAENGPAALEACQQHVPDLVLLDLMMPGMSGLDVCRSLRQIDEMAMVPVIMLTARAQESDIAQGFEAGADDYVVKPFSPRELSSRVQAALARSRR